MGTALRSGESFLKPPRTPFNSSKNLHFSPFRGFGTAAYSHLLSRMQVGCPDVEGVPSDKPDHQRNAPSTVPGTAVAYLATVANWSTV
ncbi:hypothetical protein HN588_11330 [Candidatus Bathyarchaeota archaeon]|nr:hypothetical protein [Candidatus Bathyarchaeota archaeon]